METIQKTKSPSLVLAIRLLWAAFALSFVNWAFMLSEKTFTTQMLIIMGIIFIFSISLMAWIIVKISAARNWARVLFLGLFLLGAQMTLFAIYLEFNLNPLKIIVLSIQFLLNLTALYLIFFGSAAAEFEKLSLKSKKSKVFLVLFVLLLLFVWISPFLNPGVEKEEWVKGMKEKLPALFCANAFSNPEAATMLKTKDISQEKCVSLVSNNVMDECVAKYYPELPQQLNSMTGEMWGGKIGQCVGRGFYDKYLADTKKD